MDKSKDKFLRDYAKKMGYEIDDVETARFKSLLSKTSVTIRLPEELKAEIEARAQELNIPYQRLMKDYLIEGLKRDKKIS
ncbi:MAG: hypothetical protein JNM93_09235 [Bacteriovoracaceae bacterium]|nr:hypothetical protein [Bacteriovoracaceae bacterium]